MALDGWVAVGDALGIFRLFQDETFSIVAKKTCKDSLEGVLTTDRDTDESPTALAKP